MTIISSLLADSNNSQDLVAYSNFAIFADQAIAAESNGGMQSLTFKVERSGAITSTSSINWTVKGTGINAADAMDFGGVLPSGTLTFAPNQAIGWITIQVSGDTAFEAAETFNVMLANPSTGATISTALAQGMILNDDTNPRGLNIGTNLGGISDWSPAIPFIDAFRSSRSWITQNSKIWDTKESYLLDVDANGWIKSLPTLGSTNYTYVSTPMLNNLQGRYQGGQYVVLYDGEGTLQYRWDAVKNVNASKPGRDVIEVTPSNRGILLSLTATNPDNYLRNIRVIPISQEKTYTVQPFNPDYLSKIDPFSTFRFMDWMKTNNSTQQNWSDRPTLNSSTWATNGASVEIMVQLANVTQSDAWFNMPAQATDEYVRNFAQYVKENLNPNLKVYVEYSNEVWNMGFGQSKWIIAQAKQEWTNSSDSDYTKLVDWYSRRTTQVTRIWDQVFDNQKDRVIGVMAGQAANPWVLNRALQYKWDTVRKSDRDYGIDAIAIAPYFGNYLGQASNRALLESWTTTQPDGGLNNLFDELTQGGLVPNSPAGGAVQAAINNMQKHSVIAQQRGLQLLAYEGGQHLVDSNNAAVTNLFIQANRDPRMGQIYDRYLSAWNQLGGGLFMNFSDIGQNSKWGSWGALEHVNDAGSAKYDALIRAITTGVNF